MQGELGTAMMLRGIKQGIGIFIGLGISTLFAFTVSGTIKTWATGETLTAADLNTTVQSLKTAVENASQVGISYLSAVSTTNYAGIPYTNVLASEVGLQLPMPRDGVVKSIRVLPSTNTCTVAGSVTLRKNGVDSAISLSIPAGSVAAQTTSTTLAFVAGDVLTWRLICTNGNIFTNVAYEF